MKQNNLHLVPQVIIDCADSLFKVTHDHMKDVYLMRLETIRDYCDDVIKRANTKSAFIIPSRNKNNLK